MHINYTLNTSISFSLSLSHFLFPSLPLCLFSHTRARYIFSLDFTSRIYIHTSNMVLTVIIMYKSVLQLFPRLDYISRKKKYKRTQYHIVLTVSK